MDGFRGGKPGLDSAPNTNGMSRAERFEDEKRRIIESCFSKKGPDAARKDIPPTTPSSYFTI
jgi:hypothetical protein